jgi:hypothetical protein
LPFHEALRPPVEPAGAQTNPWTDVQSSAPAGLGRLEVVNGREVAMYQDGIVDCGAI